MGDAGVRIQDVLTSAIDAAEALRMAMPARSQGFNGRRTGRRTGNAYDFAEYRDYHPGDDLRRLDWSVFARSEQLMVRQFNDEIDPSCDIVLDHSRSMGEPREKWPAALGLAALLGRAAVNGGFSCNVWHAGTEWTLEQNTEAPLEWTPQTAEADASPVTSIQTFVPSPQPRGLRILVSDLLWPGEPSPFLDRFSQGARQVFLVALDSPVEVTEAGPARLQDAETSQEHEIRLDQAAAARYRSRLSEHLAGWEQVCARSGISFLLLNAEEVLARWPVQELMRTGLLA